jgi:hypothetical protein
MEEPRIDAANATCIRCDGMGEVIRLESDGLVMSAPAYPDSPKDQRYECAACSGTGKVTPPHPRGGES